MMPLFFATLKLSALAGAYSSEWYQRKACSTLSNSPISTGVGANSPPGFREQPLQPAPFHRIV